MTGPFWTRRGADEFDAAISRPLDEQDAHEFAALLTLVRDLQAVPAPMPRADFVSDLRGRLMAEADTALLPQSQRPLTATEQRLELPPRPTRRDRRLAAALGTAAMVGATTSIAIASQAALPGESLYPVKRAIEQAQTQWADDDASRGKTLLANADTRLDEIRALSESGDPAKARAVSESVNQFSDQAESAADTLLSAYGATGDEALITELRTFTSTSMDRLSALEPVVPAASHESLTTAGEKLAAIERRTALACPVCGGTRTSIPPNLLTNDAVASSTSVTSVIVAASNSPRLLEPAKPTRPTRPTRPETPAPDPISGQDVGDVLVPELPVPTPTATPTAPVPTTPAVPKDPTTEVIEKVNDATKLLTGDLSTAVDGLPTGDQVLTEVGTTLSGTLDAAGTAVGDTGVPLDTGDVGDSLLP